MSGTFPFVDMKISNEHHAACWRALLATLSCFMFLCVWGMKNANPILYIKRVNSKMGQNVFMFKGPLETHVLEPH